MSEMIIAMLLGILEGVTEFLPVSSTGHLILAGELVGFNDESSITFKIAIQFGAILAVLVAYRARFWDVAVGLVARRPEAWLFARNILLGFLPALAIGVVAYETIRVAIQTPMLVAVALILGGIAILVIERIAKRVRHDSVEELPFGTALSIGLVQCIAMIPGVSRSGATIMGSLLMGVERKTAAEFSFFLAVPTMLAAASYALYKDRDLLEVGDLQTIAIGFGFAFIAALLVVKAFVRVVGRFGFAPFAWYRIVFGTICVIWLVAR